MGLIAKGSATTFRPAPAGTHPAICVQVIDLGKQFSQFYGKTKPKVLFGWELPNEPDDDGKPYLVWNRYTLSLHENAALRAHLEAWRGREFTPAEIEGFNLRNVLGKPCMVNIAHEVSEGKTWARVKAVMAMPKGMELPAPKHDLVWFDVDEWDAGVFDGFSDNLKKTIEASEEGQARKAQIAGEPMPVSAVDGNGSPPDEDDIPF